MTTAFQNRLVGTIIVVALAVIFLPEVLDGEKQRSQDRFASFPKPPPIKTLSSAAPFSSREVEQAVTRQVEIVDEQALDESGSIEIPPEETADPDNFAQRSPQATPANQLNAGWVVQLGSFRHKKNVRELLDKLEQAGYRTFTRPIETSSGRLTKVFVGPDLKKQNLENALPHLKDLTQLQGKLTPFSLN